MLKFDENNDLDALLNADFPEDKLKNNRVATRFIRADIDASISNLSFFNPGKSYAVQLFDITSKGVLIRSEKTLKINQNLSLTLKFRTGKVFVIKAKVVRIANNANNQFGIKFDRYNNELGEYLLDTQTKLIFK